jgi:sugar phosphate isomerase/epimerase
MGMESISADPAPESFAQLEKLVREFRIPIAIHNHGPGSRYDKLESVLKAVEGRDPLIGVCVDTGHALRSKEDPVEWVKALALRVHGMHLKDVKDATKFTVLGRGDLRLDSLFHVLSEMKFKPVISLEYEESPADPVPDIRECLEAARRSINKVGKGLAAG